MNEMDFINKWSPNGFENPYANYCFKSDLDNLKQQIRAEIINRIDYLRQQYVDACNMCTSNRCEVCKIDQFIQDLELLKEEEECD